MCSSPVKNTVYDSPAHTPVQGESDAWSPERRQAVKEMFEKFEALKGDNHAMWIFYDALSTPEKLLIWDRYPEHHKALREMERQ
jgi:hypothetical protein